MKAFFVIVGCAHLEEALATHQCVDAYHHECYDQSPFTQCCAVCSGGSNAYQCDWFFRDRVTDCEECGETIRDSFTWTEGDVDACEAACGALGGQIDHAQRHNQFLDYCPDGDVWNAVQSCPGARASLARLVTPSMCPRHDGSESCNWEHHKVLGGGTDHSSTLTLNGTFNFEAANKHCKQACDVLGASNNNPSAYCAGTLLSASGCPEAQQSLTRALEQASGWCPGSTQTELAAVPDRAGSVVKNISLDRSGAPRALRSTDQAVAAPTMLVATSDECQQAWDAQCYKDNDDWKSCCHNCDHTGSAGLSCHWDYTAPGNVGSISGRFAYRIDQNPACTNVCVQLADPTNMPWEYCPGGSIYASAVSCFPAQHSLADATHGTGMCSVVHAPAPPPIEMVALAEPAQLPVPLMAACAGIAALVAFAAAYVRPQRRHDSHGHTQHLLDSH